MKRCSKCCEDKELGAFNHKAKSKDGRSSVCTVCQREYNRAHYQNNKQPYLDRAVARKSALKEVVRQLKDRPCTDCGGKFHFAAMDFDHTADNKSFDVGRAVALGLGIDRIQAEIAKCDVVCSNCHRVRTFERYASVS
jgi:hypothetical protein